jgi:hypothetical protein
MEQALVTHAWFGALCFSFSAGGIFMLLLRPGWAKHNDSRSAVYSAFAYWLIFAQSKNQKLSLWWAQQILNE